MSYITRMIGIYIILSLICLSQGLNVTRGVLFEASSTTTANVQGIFLYHDKPLPEGVVLAYTAMFVLPLPVRFQIWRPISEERKVFRLIGQKRVVPTKLLTVATVRLSPLEYVFTQPGDRLAVYNEEETSALAHDYMESIFTDISYHNVRDQSRVRVGFQTRFEDRFRRNVFSASVTLDTEIYFHQMAAREAAARTLPPPTTPTSSSFWTPPNEGTLLYHGRPLGSSSQSQLDVRGTLFLNSDPLTRDGIIITFYLYIIHLEPVTIQVWRPVDWSTLTFMLLASYQYVPKQLGIVEVPVSYGAYIHAMRGDCLGLINKGNTSTVGYSFTPARPQTLRARLPQGNSPNPGETFTFDELRVPYDFALGAIQDIDIERYPADSVQTTPTIVTTPSVVTTLLPTLSLKIPEEEVQLAPLYKPDKILQAGARRTFLDPTLTFPKPGQLRSFWGYFMTEGQVQFQIWRPVLGKVTTYKLLARVDYEIREDYDAGDYLPALREVKLRDQESLFVEPGDLVGFLNNQSTSVIGHNFRSATLLHAPPSGDLGLDSEVRFDVIGFPYSFALTASYIPGREKPTIDPGSVTDEASNILSTIVTKEVDSTSQVYTQSQLDVTTDGGNLPTDGSTPRVTPRPAAAIIEEDDPLAFVKNQYFLLILLIWLIILTLLLIIICVVITCFRSRDTHKRATMQYPSSFINWGGHMRMDEDLGYFNPGIGSRNHVTRPSTSEGSDEGEQKRNTHL